MHGLGRASAAVTIVNALPTGVGCALGIGLYAEAEVTLDPLEPARSGAAFELTVDAASRTPLVESAVRAGLEEFAPSGSWSVDLRLTSEVPVARGLKSSSAVASAVVASIAAALGGETSPLGVARLSARSARAAGVSATGALDDALAGLTDGFVVTDNLHDRLLRTGPADPDWEVALFVPESQHARSPEWAEVFGRSAPEGRAAVDACERGDWWTAMSLNSALVERTMGYDYHGLRERVKAAGALGAGVSGLGPAFAAVAPRDRIPRIHDCLPVSGGSRRSVPLRPPLAASGGRAT